jgi:iron complex transport system ATP-binding protein
MTLLTASNLRFAYGARPILHDVAVSLAGGEVVALIGPNGSGKSTLIRVLLGHLPVSGSLRWNDRPIRQWSPRELAKVVAYLPQTPVYDEDQTVLETLQLGRSPYMGAFGIESADDMKITADIAGQLELDDLLSRRMDELSGGQRQRVFVGRCLVQQPRALLLDEPNTFLDLQYQAELVSLIRTLSGRGIGVLIATHDLNLAAAVADRLVLLQQGSVAAEGPVDRVMDAALLSRAFNTPLVRIEGKRPVIVPEYR